MRRIVPTLAVLCALTLTGAAQQPLPRFEVASVKPSSVRLYPLGKHADDSLWLFLCAG